MAVKASGRIDTALLLMVTCLVFVTPVLGIYPYVPGIRVRSYREGEQVAVWANGLHSNTAVLPYSFYELPMCYPPGGIRRRIANLGEVLQGDLVTTSGYSFRMLEPVACQPLDCEDHSAGARQTEITMARLAELIERNYNVRHIVDNLPVFTNGTFPTRYCRGSPRFEDVRSFQQGFALGVSKRCTGGPTLVNNHVHFELHYHVRDEVEGEPAYAIVGASAVPSSVRRSSAIDHHSYCDSDFDWKQIPSMDPQTTEWNGQQNVIEWTYSVNWVEEPSITWAKRWDSYLSTSFANVNDRIQMVGLVNACLVIAIIAVVVLVRRRRRALRLRDSSSLDADAASAVVAARPTTPNTAKAEPAQRVVSEDCEDAACATSNATPTTVVAVEVPQHRGSVPFICLWLLATGTQIVGTLVCVVLVGLFGLSSPANRGVVLMSGILLYFANAGPACFYAGRRRAPNVAIATAVGMPSLILILWGFAIWINCSNRATSAVHLPTVITLMVLWLLLDLPLAMLGAWLGRWHLEGRGPISPPPTATDDEDEAEGATLIRSAEAGDATGEADDLSAGSSWWQRYRDFVAPYWVLPWGAMSLQLHFFLAAVWQDNVYYQPGYVALAVLLWIATCIAVVALLEVFETPKDDQSAHAFLFKAAFASSGCGLPMVIGTSWWGMVEMTFDTPAAAATYVVYSTLLVCLYAFAAAAIGIATAIKLRQL